MKIQPIPPQHRLLQFRKDLKALLPKRSCAILNLIDALSADGHRYRSPTALSLSAHFERQYASVTDAIHHFSSADWNQISALLCQYAQLPSVKKMITLITDCTPLSRPFARTLADRKFTHAPNPTPGNKPITIGHEYSVLTQVVDSKWLAPLDTRQVHSTEKGNEIGVRQFIHYIKSQADNDAFSQALGIGDSLYGSHTCRSIAATQSQKLLFLFRLKGNRVLYEQIDDEATLLKKRGRKSRYGKQVKLSDGFEQSPDHTVTITRCTYKGITHTVKLEVWDDMLIRGTKDFKSYNYPLRILKATVSNEDGETVFKRPLWLALQGEHANTLTPAEIYHAYSQRYDIEHFFRFGKQKLMMNSFQTPCHIHELSWQRIVMLAYFQLYLARDDVEAETTPWGKYLQSYKERAPDAPLTPSMTQGGMSSFFNQYWHTGVISKISRQSQR